MLPYHTEPDSTLTLTPNRYQPALLTSIFEAESARGNGIQMSLRCRLCILGGEMNTSADNKMLTILRRRNRPWHAAQVCDSVKFGPAVTNFEDQDKDSVVLHGNSSS